MRPSAVVYLLAQRFGAVCEHPTREEHRFAEDIVEILEAGFLPSFGCEVYEEESFDVDESEPVDESLDGFWPADDDYYQELSGEAEEEDQLDVTSIVPMDLGEQQERDDPTYQPSPNWTPGQGDKLEDEYMERAYRFWTNQADDTPLIVLPKGEQWPKKKRPESVVIHHFRRMGSIDRLYAFQTRMRNGNKARTMRLLNERVMILFTETRAAHGTVQTLQSWAMELKETLDPDNKLHFSASPSWVTRFKRKYRIVSRKITHRVSRTFSADELKIREKARNFVTNIKEITASKNLPPSLIINFDQTRCEKEPHRGRTLEHKGTKKVMVQAGSKTATTHSNCAHIGVNMAGELLSPAYLLISEPSGVFPESFQDFLMPPNVMAFAGKSANMKKTDLETFLRSCFWPSVAPILEREDEDRLLLMVDSWSANSDAGLYASTIPDTVNPDPDEGFMRKIILQAPLASFSHSMWAFSAPTRTSLSL